MTSHSSELQAAERWLQRHSQSLNTRRKYESQLQQFCEWLIVRELRLLNVAKQQVEDYLVALADGDVEAMRSGAQIIPARSTVRLARSVLCSLFDAFVDDGLRPDNPARKSHLPEDRGTSDRVRSREATPRVRWLEVRRDVIEAARKDGSERSALRRAVAIAELATWSGLRRSELALASMADFRSMSHRWWISVARFGRGEEELVEVPQPAMDALALYRLSRELPELPTPTEKDVPLIARLLSEVPVNSWSVAKSMEDLMRALPNEQTRPPAIVALRREVASQALRAQIAAHQVAQHLRSRTLVDQAARQLSREPISQVLERLAA